MAVSSSRAWGLGFSNADGVTRPRDLVQRACDAMCEASGLNLVPYVASSYDDLASAICSGEVGIAWIPPVPAIELIDHGVVEALVVPLREDDTSYHSALVVRKGSIKSLDDLRGRRIAWVSPESASGYVVPRVNIAAAGHDVLHFFGREVFLRDHRAVIDAVARGEADAGATFCGVNREGKVTSGTWLTEEGVSTRNLDVLCTYGPIPSDAIVASTELPAVARSQITRWLLALEDPALLLPKLLRSKSLRIATRDHFDPLRHMLRTARARGFDALPPASRRSIRVGK